MNNKAKHNVQNIHHPRKKPRVKSSPIPDEDTRKGSQFQHAGTNHQLPGNQEELRIQNEELQITNKHLELIEEKYHNLFSFAPIAYFVLDDTGFIQEANIQATHLLQTSTYPLTKTPFSNYVAPENANTFHLSMSKALESHDVVTCEIDMLNNRSVPFFALLHIFSLQTKKIYIAVQDITQRKQAEQALRESEVKAKTIVKYAPTGIFEIDYKTAYFLTVNDALCIITGYSRSELLKIKSSDILDDDSRQIMNKRMSRLFAGEEIEGPVEYNIVKKNGIKANVIVEVVFENKREKPFIGIGIVHDITDRKKEEEQLKNLTAVIQEEKDRLAALVNSIPDEVWFADTNGNFALANPSALSEFGMESIGKIDIEALIKSLEILRPDGNPRPVDEAPALRALKGETVKNAEEIVRTPAKKELHHRLVNAAPVKDVNGKIIGAVCVVRDITSRKKALAQLKESEERFRIVFEQSSIGKSLTLPDGKMLKVNQALADMLGYTIEDLQKLSVESITHPDDIPASRECIRSLLAREKTAYRFEKRYLHKNGNAVWADVSASLVSDTTGEPLYFIASIINITERKKSDELLKNISINSPVSTYILQDGKFQYVNRQLVKEIGYTEEGAPTNGTEETGISRGLGTSATI